MGSKKEAVEEIVGQISNLAEFLSTGKEKNICWWDMEECPFQSEIKGLQEATSKCGNCGRLDDERFISVLEEIFSGLTKQVELEKIPGVKEKLDKAKEEAHKEGYEEREKEETEGMEDEIYDEILEHLTGLKESLEELKNKSRR